MWPVLTDEIALTGDTARWSQAALGSSVSKSSAFSHLLWNLNRNMSLGLKVLSEALCGQHVLSNRAEGVA